MLLTVTPNSALDRDIFIQSFDPGTVLRANKMVDGVGGKGLCASVALRHLGQETTAISFVAGETGKALVRLLDSYGIQHDLVWVAGETRTAFVIAETGHFRHTHLIAGGYTLAPGDIEKMFARFDRWLPSAAWVLTGGSLPDGFPPDGYEWMTARAVQAGRPILIDCSGTPALAAARARPTILKMNKSEFMQTFDAGLPGRKALLEAARRVRSGYHLDHLVITLGEEGILALTPQGEFLAKPPRQVAINAAGAGDAASAALAWRLSCGDDWPDSIRWAAAAGAAVVLTERTSDCCMDDVLRIYSQVIVQPAVLLGE